MYPGVQNNPADYSDKPKQAGSNVLNFKGMFQSTE